MTTLNGTQKHQAVSARTAEVPSGGRYLELTVDARKGVFQIDQDQPGAHLLGVQFLAVAAGRAGEGTVILTIQRHTNSYSVIRQIKPPRRPKTLTCHIGETTCVVKMSPEDAARLGRRLVCAAADTGPDGTVALSANAGDPDFLFIGATL